MAIIIRIKYEFLKLNLFVCILCLLFIDYYIDYYLLTNVASYFRIYLDNEIIQFDSMPTPGL